MAQPKVFEFAKEIGVETLVLMDKIREWKLPVKSHMAELPDDVLTAIRERFAEEVGGKKKKAKKKATTKKKKTATAAKKTTKKKVVKAATKKTAAKKAVAKKTKTVIRRTKPSEEPEAEPQVAETVAAAAAAEVVPVTVVIEAPTVVGTPVVETPAVETSVVDAVTETPTEVVAAAPVEKVVEPVVEKPTKVVARARKREIPMTDGGPVSGVASKAPKKNIVGKIDLSKVEKMKQQMRPQKTANRNIRTGFVAQAPLDPNPTTSMYDNRKDRKPAKRPVPPPAGPSAKDKEALPPTFVSSDFKKREVVFQPKKKKVMIGAGKKTEITVPKASKRVVKVYGAMTVSELSDSMNIRAHQLLKALMKSGVTANMNSTLDFETISLITPEFKYDAENIKKTDVELLEVAAFGDLDAEKVTRSPVVTVMGHVDHGKTTLLDTIRKARVAAGEAGGITQHIGAYRVKTSLGEVTFIDTPGHAAFTEMRARGAHATDIVILVVAADDGAMPQTVEALNHAKAAGVPIVVAVNKMDKPDANPDKIKQQLSEHELVAEDWGGDTPFCPVSALKGDGVDSLLEQLSLIAEMQELKGNPKRSATGVVIESRVEKGRGNVATLLVKDGTLKQGQHLVIGETACRARQLISDSGKTIKEAGPSIPVEITGLPVCPLAGDRFDACVDEKAAAGVAGVRKEELAAARATTSGVSLEDLFEKIKQGNLKELPIVLKTDVAGSAEAVKGMFDKVSTEEVKIKVIHSAVGGISESDVLLAGTAGGMAVGFNVRPDSGAQRAAKEKGVDIRTYTIIYELVDDMKKAMAGLLDPDIVEKVLGRVEVRDIFSVPKIGTIAGCFVTDGKVTRNSMLRLLREGKVVYQGKISSLKRFKDDAKEVANGYECGVGIENYNDIKVGDEIEAYVEEKVAREL